MAELVLATPRLVVRGLTLGDAAAVHAAVESDRDWLESFLRWPHAMQRRADVERWIGETPELGTAFRLGVFLADGELAGCLGAQPKFARDEIDLSYWLRRRFTGRGLAREAVARLSAWAASLPEIAAVTIHCEPRNTASRRVALGAGFVCAGPVAGADPPLERFEVVRGATAATGVLASRRHGR